MFCAGVLFGFGCFGVLRGFRILGSGLVDFLQVGAVQILVAFELLRSGSWVNLVFGVLNRFLLVCVVAGFWLCLVLSFGCFGDLLCWWFVVCGFWFPGF